MLIRRLTWFGLVGITLTLPLGLGAHGQDKDDNQPTKTIPAPPGEQIPNAPEDFPPPDDPGGIPLPPEGIDGFPPDLRGIYKAQAQKERLGADFKAPDKTLAVQLDLPDKQGMILVRVTKGSPAEKAGLKKHDIVLEANGKAVPTNAAKFGAILEAIEEGKEVTFVVLRKGRNETIKGIKLPKTQRPRNDPFGAPPGFPGPGVVGAPPEVFPPDPGPPPDPGLPPGAGFPDPAAPFPGFGGGVTLTTFRGRDRWTTRYEEGRLIITVTAKTAEGKSEITGIHVQDGRFTENYKSLTKVPQRYEDKVKLVVETGEKSAQIKVEKP